MADQAPRGQGLSRDQLQDGDQGPRAAVEEEGLGRFAGQTAAQPLPLEVAYHYIQVPHVRAYLSGFVTCDQLCKCKAMDRRLVSPADDRLESGLLLALQFNTINLFVSRS